MSIEKKCWKEFKDTKLLWYINGLLHVFGWTIVVESKDGVISDVYPARTTYRGFSEESNTEGYKGLSEYMHKESDKLVEETKNN